MAIIKKKPTPRAVERERRDGKCYHRDLLEQDTDIRFGEDDCYT
jgi:hypothetical protein